MAIGSNGGGLLNIFIFEVGVITTDPTTGAELVTTVSVHPLLVAPRSVRYTDSSRSPTTETTGGAILTRAGRAMRTCQADGSFGVESRGLGPYIGSGEMRFQRFYKEVVRMSDALSADDVAACVDILNGTPFISLLVKPFIEGVSTFFINFYDFLNDISFECNVQAYNWTREHRNGGATGLAPYQMVIKEVGPLKEGSLGTEIISGLMTILGTWDDINDVVASYTITDIIDAQLALVSIGASELADTVAAVNAQVQAVQSLMGGKGATGLATSAGNDGVSSFLADCQRLAEQASAVATALNQSAGTGTFDNDTASIDPAAVSGEGRNRTLEIADRMREAQEVEDAARFYLSVGKFYGLSRAEYQAFIHGGGVQGLAGPNRRGSETYTVSSTDTPAAIERRFGVTWSDVLDANGLTPDEALQAGTVLVIPLRRPAGPQGIKGLPTFGSHIGKAAWGVDLPLELVATDGRPVLVAEEEVLVQGVTYLTEQSAAELLRAAQSVPDAVKTSYLSKRLTSLFMLDQRFDTPERVAVSLGTDGAFDVEVTLHAINGGTVTTGGSRR